MFLLLDYSSFYTFLIKKIHIWEVLINIKFQFLLLTFTLILTTKNIIFHDTHLKSVLTKPLLFGGNDI